jgi:hypothetical protein
VTKLLLGIAIGIGLLAAYVDNQPNWDDTAVMALGILVAAGLLSLIEPRYPWLWALAVGIWIPLFGIALARNFGSLLAMAFALAGAYAGMAFRKVISTA